jgi:Mn-dependent transcriptional regulator
VGREVAEQIYEKHRFFTDRLIEAGADPETAERDACRMEHVISQESFEHPKNAYKTKE